jgi:FPC/CPF motif-containing protein YcgG
MQAEDSNIRAPEKRKRQVSDWRTRIILGDALGVEHFPEWLETSYDTMRTMVVDDDYPCYFGTMAERRGEMFYSYVNGKNIADLPATMATFARLANQAEFRKNNIAIFFEPDAVPLTHQAYHDHFWGILQHLHNVDPDPEADYQHDPNDEGWEFSFAGLQMFVVCALPSFALRHSRNLGPGMVLLFQPRAVFVDTITNKVIGREARNQVRERLRKWDDVAPHPDLGFYGDPGNLEWKQYFLDDENRAAQDRCPFLKRVKQIRDADAVAAAQQTAAAAGAVKDVSAASPPPPAKGASSAASHAGTAAHVPSIATPHAPSWSAAMTGRPGLPEHPTHLQTPD